MAPEKVVQITIWLSPLNFEMFTLFNKKEEVNSQIGVGGNLHRSSTYILPQSGHIMFIGAWSVVNMH